MGRGGSRSRNRFQAAACGFPGATSSLTGLSATGHSPQAGALKAEAVVEVGPETPARSLLGLRGGKGNFPGSLHSVPEKPSPCELLQDDTPHVYTYMPGTLHIPLTYIFHSTQAHLLYTPHTSHNRNSHTPHICIIYIHIHTNHTHATHNA